MAKIEIELSDGTKAGETLAELSKQANSLNSQLRKLKPGTEEFTNKSKDLQQVSGRMKDVRDQIKGTTDASDKLKNAFLDIIPFGGQFKSFAGKVSGVKDSVGGLSTASGMLKKAMLGIPILLIVAALASLVSWFTSTQEGMDKVTSVTRPLLAVFDKMKGVIQELGGSVFKGLSLILNGEFKEGLKVLGDGFVDVIGNTRKAIEEGWEAGKRLDALQKQIEKNEIQQIVRAKELELVINRQKAIVEDETKSIEQRIDAAKRARAAQDDLEKDGLTLINLRIEKLKLQQSLNNTSREDELELARLLAERLDIQSRIAGQAIEFDKKINELNAKRNAETQASMEEVEEFNQQFVERQNKLAQFQEERMASDAEREKQRIQASMVALAKKLQSDKAARDEDLADRKAKAEAIKLMEQEQIALFNEGANSLVSLLGATTEARKKNAAAIKTFTVGQIAVNLQNEIQGLFASFASLGPFGQAAAIARAIFATIRATAAIKRVTSQKFEAGGILRGPSHRQGGIPIEAEGDEIILSKGVYRNTALRKMASRINVLGGGRRFEAGGPVNPFSRPTTAQASGTDSQLLDLSPVVDEMRNMNAAINARFDRIKVVNVATETEDVLKTINSIKDQANV